ncbi:MAG: Type III pantothenate kinase [Bacteroidetes bacterium ADurb.Bin408]|nr:MAG: Type III pantothenate kinase [Bacteroidetes bacterium ADurb.Bin408]
MNLVIDIGNSYTKVAVFENEKTVVTARYRRLNIRLLNTFLFKNQLSGLIDACILCTVSTYPEEIIRFLKQHYTFIFFDHTVPVPVLSQYKTPETLGKDRLAAAVGASSLFKSKNVLCIDMGTCIKYDFVNKNNVYCGGSISPGYEMRFKALNTFTEKLPLIKSRKINFLTGKNTEESILSGVFNGISSEISDMINKYKKRHTSLKVIISGGDMKNLDKELKMRIFAVPNIVTLGLNIILNYNKKQLK